MKETGIIMSGDHPKLVLDGVKTMTRRVIKPQYIDWQGHHWYGKPSAFHLQFNDFTLEKIITHCPYGQVGNRLWVREAWAADKIYDDRKPRDIPWVSRICYFRGGTGEGWDWVGKTRSAMFLPRWASRITLEITDIRVERVQEIKFTDCEEEGIKTGYRIEWDAKNDLLRKFEALWDSLNAKRGYSWSDNPWVWVISFKLVR